MEGAFRTVEKAQNRNKAVVQKDIRKKLLSTSEPLCVCSHTSNWASTRQIPGSTLPVIWLRKPLDQHCMEPGLFLITGDDGELVGPFKLLDKGLAERRKLIGSGMAGGLLFLMNRAFWQSTPQAVQEGSKVCLAVLEYAGKSKVGTELTNEVSL
eukprot:gene29970-18036_t